MRTFILGAGASMHYGLPSGFELKQLLLDEVKFIQRSLASSRPFYSNGGFDRETLDDFVEGFTMGQEFTTIDNFLGQMADEDFKRIGNALIALVISKKQSQIDFSDNQDWYELFFKLMKDSSEEEVKKTKIITFNYDTSLEKFMEKRIVAETPRTFQKEIKVKLCNIEYIHPHGKLPFTESYDTSNVFTKAPIKTISDDFSNDSNYHKARKIISNSNEIVFMGFGYHKEILDNLFDTKSEQSDFHLRFPVHQKNIVGTNYKLQKPSFRHHLFEKDIFPKTDLNCKEMIELLAKHKSVSWLKDAVYVESVQRNNALERFGI